MSALHWICALTLALVCCLSAQPVKRDAYDKVSSKDEILKNLESFKDVAKNNCPNDTKIYSPADVRQGCLSSALNCTIMELKVILEECGLEDEKKDDDLNVFDNFYSGLVEAKSKASTSSSTSSSSSSSPCNTCEAYPTKNVEDFLEDIKSLVEKW